MESFTKYKAVKLRSHLDKYLIANNDGETVSQSRNGSTRNSKWIVELVDGRTDLLRLKSFTGKYLSASDSPFLLGMTGKRVNQTSAESNSDQRLNWEPVKDGFQVKLKSWCGKFLRANGGTPPWRNTVTHDEPHAGSTVRWILWDVEAVELPESLSEYLLTMSSFSSVSEKVLEAASDEYFGSEPGSPVSPVSVISSVRTRRLTVVKSMSPRLSPKKVLNFQSNTNDLRSPMEYFANAKAVRLRSHHDKYLHADDDEETVTQDRNGSSKNARWTVEPVPGSGSILRLKSCYGKYLTASNMPFLLGMTGRKVLQTLPRRLDSSVEWEPIRDGTQVKLKTRYGHYLRGNGGLPPWRNSVTHDIPHRTSTQDWILWDVDIAEIQVKSNRNKPEPPPIEHQDSLDFDSSSPSSASAASVGFSRHESTESNVSSPPKSEGRTIYYHVADENGDFDDDLVEAYSMHFKGTGVAELTQKLREETGLYEIVVCSRSPLNGKLYPLRLQLPPNNADMHVVVVESSSKLGKEFGGK